MDDPPPFSINGKAATDHASSDIGTLNDERRGLLPAPVFTAPRRRNIIVEPVMFLFNLGILGNDPLIELYTHTRLAEEFPILTNRSGDINNTQCTSRNQSDPLVIAEGKVDAQTSAWQTYLAMPILLPTLTCTIYGAYSDIFGRRPILLFTSVLAAVKFLINALVIYYNLPFYLILIANIIEAIGGGYYTLIMGVYAYLADTVDLEKLGIRMTIVDILVSLSTAISQVALGFSIKYIGFFYTYIILAGCILMNLIYVMFFVPETIIRDKNKRLEIRRRLKSIWTTFTNKDGRRHVKIALLIFSFFLSNLYMQSQLPVQILYIMGPPLCWGAVKIGAFTGATLAFQQITGIVSIEVFTWCKIPEMIIAAIGVISAAVSSLVNAWADSLLWMIIVSLASLFTMLPLAMMRTTASKLFNEDEQGRVLAGFSSIGGLSYIISMFTLNTIYQQTLDFMEGFVFIVAAGFCLLSLVVIMGFLIFKRTEDKSGQSGERRIVNE